VSSKFVSILNVFALIVWFSGICPVQKHLPGREDLIVECGAIVTPKAWPNHIKLHGTYSSWPKVERDPATSLCITFKELKSRHAFFASANAIQEWKDANPEVLAALEGAEQA